MLWQCRHNRLGSSVKSVLGLQLGQYPPTATPIPTPACPLGAGHRQREGVKVGGWLAWGQWQSLRASWAQERKDM